MYQSTCGYQDHYCNAGVQFISRYKDENDYCVAGVRVTLHDNGRLHWTCTDRISFDVAKRSIQHYLLTEYAEYLIWHHKQGYGREYLQPFRYTELWTSVFPSIDINIS